MVAEIIAGRVVYFQTIDDSTALTTGQAKALFIVPPTLNGMNLVDADAFVVNTSSSGLPTIDIHNFTQAVVSMLLTKITIDVGEASSYTATTPPVIDTDHDNVATADVLRIDVDGAGTGVTGLHVVLTFRLP